MKLTHTAPQARDFSAIDRANLLAKGIRIIGVTYLPGVDGSYANGETDYELDNNGQGQIRTWRQVVALVAMTPPHAGDTTTHYYEVREREAGARPEDNGRIVSLHRTFAEAMAKATELDAAGRNVSVNRSAS